jgi:inner membrane protein
MPSPVGHSLAALAAAWIVEKPDADKRQLLKQSALVAVVSVLPDLDLLWNRHSRETHSIGAALIVATVAGLIRLPVASTRGRIWVTAFLAMALHPLFDMLAADGAPPYGVMLFWPFSREFVDGPITIFDPISRAFGELATWKHNGVAMAAEALKIGPVAALVFWIRARQRPY